MSSVRFLAIGPSKICPIVRVAVNFQIIAIDIVQLNSNLTLACVSFVETQLIFKFARDLVASA